MRTWIVGAALFAISVGAQASHFGWRRVVVDGAEHGIVSSHGMDLFEISTSAGGYSPARRAEVIAGRLEELSDSHDLSPQMFSVGFRNSMVIIQQQEHAEHLPHIVATIDPALARRCLGASGSPERLAEWRLALLRDHVSLAIGRLPVYTSGTPVGNTFRKLFGQMESSGDGVHSQEIDRAFAKLPESDRDLFRRAACTVPDSFNPDRVIVIQPLPARRAESASGKEPEHTHKDDHEREPEAKKPVTAKQPPVPDPDTPRGTRKTPAPDSDTSRGARIRKNGDYSVELLTDPAAMAAGKKTPIAVRVLDTRTEGGRVADAIVRAWLSPKGERPKQPVIGGYDERAQAYTFDAAPESPGDYTLVVGVLAGADAAFKVEFPLTVAGEAPAETVERPEDRSRPLTRHAGDFDVTMRARPDPPRVGGDSIVELLLVDTTDKTEPRSEDRPLAKAAVTGWFVPEGRKETDVEARGARQNPDMPGMYGWGIRFARPGNYRLVVEVTPGKGKKFKVEFPLQVSPE